MGVVPLRFQHYRLPQLLQTISDFFYQGVIDCSVYNSGFYYFYAVYYAIVNKGQFFALSPLLVNQIDTYTDRISR